MELAVVEVVELAGLPFHKQQNSIPVVAVVEVVVPAILPSLTIRSHQNPIPVVAVVEVLSYGAVVAAVTMRLMAVIPLEMAG